MVAPLEIPRNTSRAQSEGRAGKLGNSTAKGIIKAGARKPRPWRGTSILLPRLGRKHLGPEMPGVALGMSESGVPVTKHSVPPDNSRNILRDVARIDVHEVGNVGGPVERKDAAKTKSSCSKP